MQTFLQLIDEEEHSEATQVVLSLPNLEKYEAMLSEFSSGKPSSSLTEVWTNNRMLRENLLSCLFAFSHVCDCFIIDHFIVGDLEIKRKTEEEILMKMTFSLPKASQRDFRWYTFVQLSFDNSLFPYCILTPEKMHHFNLPKCSDSRDPSKFQISNWQKHLQMHHPVC